MNYIEGERRVDAFILSKAQRKSIANTGLTETQVNAVLDSKPKTDYHILLEDPLKQNWLNEDYFIIHESPPLYFEHPKNKESTIKAVARTIARLFPLKSSGGE